MVLHRFLAFLLLANCLCNFSLTEAFTNLAPLAPLRNSKRSTGSRTHTSSLLRLQAHAAAVDMNPYDSSKVAKEEPYDTIVIGSGIGGLAAASMLAQNGQKVLVLEQHYVAGGACHTFSRKGYSFGTGIHYVADAGDLRPGQKFNLRTILNTLTGEEDPVQWDKMKDQAETVTLGDPQNRFLITAGSLERYKQSLVEMFPDEKEAIEKFLSLCEETNKASMMSVVFKILPFPVARFLVRTGLHRLFDGGYRKFTKMTVAEVLDDLTDNKNLQAVLASNFGDFGVEPGRAPFFMQATVHQAYWNGSFYPRGGPSTLPRKVIKNILAHGGNVFTKASARKINVDTDGKTVTGVEMDDGSTIQARHVVSDVGLFNTATKLLPAGIIDLDFAKDDQKGDAKLHPSCSGLNLFVGLKGSPKDFNLPQGMNWIYPSNDLTGAVDRLRGTTLDQALTELQPKDLPMVVSIPCTTDSQWETNHPNKSVLEVIMFAPWRWFEDFTRDFHPSGKGHGPEYAQAKKILAKKMWQRVVEVLQHAGANVPQSLDAVDHYEIATPLTFEHFYKADRGGFYGVENDKNRFEPRNYFLKLRPKVHGINGLFLAGQDVMSMGIQPCAMSGVMCAASVLGHKGNPFAMLETDEVAEDAGPTIKELGEEDDWSVEGAAHAR